MILSRILNKIKQTWKQLYRKVSFGMYNVLGLLFGTIRLKKHLQKNQSPENYLKHHADGIRFVEIRDQDQELKNAIVTCYFTKKSDPQLGTFRNKSDFQYIQPWYDSLLKINVNGIILHDGLEEEFIKKYQTPLIQFRYCEMGNYSIFEERWFLYHHLINQLVGLERIFFTDSNDVFIHSNPFLEFTNLEMLYVGRDNANRIKDSAWLLDELKDYQGETKFVAPSTYFGQFAYNAGVIGGSVEIIKFLTSKMVEFIIPSKSSKHKDMTILNLVIHSYFYPMITSKNWQRRLVEVDDDLTAINNRIYTGFPLNSGFKNFDFESKAVFIHK